MTIRPTMPAGLATRVYDVLVAECAAPDGEFDRLNFVREYERPMGPNGPASEYRFQGALEFGGKFRFPKMTVDCYPEHETPAVLRLIAAANARLAVLNDEMQETLQQATGRSPESTI